jgi:hypothetical protein
MGAMICTVDDCVPAELVPGLRFGLSTSTGEPPLTVIVILAVALLRYARPRCDEAALALGQRTVKATLAVFASGLFVWTTAGVACVATGGGFETLAPPPAHAAAPKTIVELKAPVRSER